MSGKRDPREDLRIVQSFTSSDPYRDQQARFRDWFGWRPSTAVRCPRTIAGKRCRNWANGEPCMCELHNHVLDHACRWINGDGNPVLTSEPYDFDAEEFVALAADCAALGLDVSVTGTSPYFPGRTVLIIIRKKKA